MTRALVIALALLGACEGSDRNAFQFQAPSTEPGSSATAPPSAPPATQPPQAPPAAQAAVSAATLRKGDKVSAQWTNGRWYPGTLTAVYDDGTADVRYDDGDRSRGLPFAKIKLVKRPVFEASVSSGAPSGATKKAKLVEGASCSGPGWRHVCGGRCTDVQTDSANCGSCGNRCDDGYRCDGSGTCRNASGGL